MHLLLLPLLEPVALLGQSPCMASGCWSALKPVDVEHLRTPAKAYRGTCSGWHRELGSQQLPTSPTQPLQPPCPTHAPPRQGCGTGRDCYVCAALVGESGFVTGAQRLFACPHCSGL